MSKPRFSSLVLGGIGLLAIATVTSATAPQSDAPQFERRLYSIEVQDADGVAYDHPFLGGFNMPRPHLVDIVGAVNGRQIVSYHLADDLDVLPQILIDLLD